MDTVIKLLVVFVSVLIVMLLAISINAAYTDSVVKFCVKDKAVIVSAKTSKYLIFTEDEVFEVTDSLRFGRFNSSDIYSSLEVNSCYTSTAQGQRIPFLSMYRNILSPIKTR